MRYASRWGRRLASLAEGRGLSLITVCGRCPRDARFISFTRDLVVGQKLFLSSGWEGLCPVGFARPYSSREKTAFLAGPARRLAQTSSDRFAARLRLGSYPYGLGALRTPGSPPCGRPLRGRGIRAGRFPSLGAFRPAQKK